MPKTAERKRFEGLYEAYHRLVRSVLFHMTGERALDDLVQETFLRIWQGLPRFALRSSVKTWVYRVTVNVAIDHLRRRGARAIEIATERAGELDEAPPAGNEPRHAPLVRDAIQALDEPHRIVLVLHYFEEMSVGGIATVLDLPQGTVKSRLHHARLKLKARFEQEGITL